MIEGKLTANPTPGSSRRENYLKEITMTDRLLFTEEVADMLRKSYGTMRFMIHKGTAPKSALIGGRRMFRESDVYAWIEDQFEKEASK